ncbi:hypothetical protein ATE92_2628 [Ulvibacter sp. MAR_2010_11]|uniref:hypothetical protein n=1 Tax=Ulvibacter sp. MAR_2010_11 TaxID=1250229 RepID=UPI000C2CD9D1|nr:hypothetical protein [Ulvibacter sp. MAR_2010_11]PKA84438.1 hypothetical protein ATE92_2628 [Ulvibacter sp. MAR_2010_11]
MSNTDNKITLQQAINWTTNWRSSPSTSARAFLIPIEDLEGVVAEIKSQGAGANARAYLAIDNGVEKLIIVGTKKNASGVYVDLLPANSDDVSGTGNSIWDFTEPCPPQCDPNSPLN